MATKKATQQTLRSKPVRSTFLDHLDKHGPLLRIPEAAKRLSIEEKTLWNWIYLRKVAVVRLSRGAVRIPSEAVDEMIARATVPAID